MAYRIELSKDAKKSLDGIGDARLARRFSAAFGDLAENPRAQGCLKLTGSTDLYRVRVGDYRILYQIRDSVLLVLVVAIGNRREIYR